MTMPRTGILGGTFNPVHIGHLRLALESAESLGLDRQVFMPSYLPPHKNERAILPFALRVDCLRAAVRGVSAMGVSTLEEELPVPSYAWNTLRMWQAHHPGEHGVYILGAEDFAGIGSWFRGRELPEMMDFAVVARARSGLETFHATLAALWPEIRFSEKDDAVCMPGGTQCRFIVMPPLDISASLIRAKWLRGQDLRFLGPDAALALLHGHRQAVAAIWRTGENHEQRNHDFPDHA
jgi:nicotinate-nucleotide adenylyltransferase